MPTFLAHFVDGAASGSLTHVDDSRLHGSLTHAGRGDFGVFPSSPVHTFPHLLPGYRINSVPIGGSGENREMDIRHNARSKRVEVSRPSTCIPALYSDTAPAIIEQQ